MQNWALVAFPASYRDDIPQPFLSPSYTSISHLPSSLLSHHLRSDCSLCLQHSSFLLFLANSRQSSDLHLHITSSWQPPEPDSFGFSHYACSH